MKIIFALTRADEIGGAQVHVRDMASALAERGHDVAVVAGHGGDFADVLRERGIRFLHATGPPRATRLDWANRV